MYTEALLNPQNLNYYFSEVHAVLLSFRWSLDGIGAAPFRPLAIWKQIEQGKGWIPYPKLNIRLAQSHPFKGVKQEVTSLFSDLKRVKFLRLFHLAVCFDFQCTA